MSTTLLLAACNDANEGGGAVSAAESDLRTRQRPELICHIPGKDWMKASEILVAPTAVEAHLRHGDSRGPCPFCTRRQDGISCNDGNLCTHNDRCERGTCVGVAVECAAPGSCQAASCDGATGACILANLPDRTGCDDGVACTVGDQCLNGMCVGGTIPGKVVGPSTTTLTCPAEATAVDGIVTPTCAFPASFAPNNIFTGPVSLISHLDRDFANFDVNATPTDGTIQVGCVYRDADGLQIGGITTFVTTTSCTATSDAFICTH